MVCAPNAKKQTHAHGMYWDCREFEAAGSPGRDVWRWGAALSEAGAVAALEEAAVGLVTGLLPMATRHQRIEVAGLEYRSSRSMASSLTKIAACQQSLRCGSLPGREVSGRCTAACLAS